MGVRGGFRSAMALLAIVAPVCGQAVISAKAGLIYYFEGRVLLDGKPLETAPGKFAEMAESSEIQTGDGRAEVLLNPRVFLRLGANTTVRMTSNRLSDTRIEFVSGAAIIEAKGILTDKQSRANSVSIAYGGTSVHLLGNGVYRFDGEVSQLRVYAGAAEVMRPSRIQVGAGESIALSTPDKPRAFDAPIGDSLDEWSVRRAVEIAHANKTYRRTKDTASARPVVWGQPSPPRR